MNPNPEPRSPKTVVLGVLGVDAHVVGNKIMAHALEREGFKVVNIGIFSHSTGLHPCGHRNRGRRDSCRLALRPRGDGVPRIPG